MATEPIKQSKTAEETPAETTVKPPRTPRQKLRSIEELNTTAATAMTRDEAMKYIKFIREENTKLRNKVEALEESVKSAFAKAELISRNSVNIEKAYAEQIDYAMSSIRNLKTALDCAAQVTTAHINNLKKGI